MSTVRDSTVLVSWRDQRPLSQLCAVPSVFALLPWRQTPGQPSPDPHTQLTRCFPTLAIVAGWKLCRREVPGQANKGVPTN